MTRKSEVEACFVVQGTLANAQVFLHRELIWPSCDSTEHRRYLKTLMEQKAARMNKAGATVSVNYQQPNKNGLWETATETH